MILSRKFCVYLHFTASFTSWRNFASDKAGFCKTNTLQVKNFTLKVLIEVLFMIFVFLFFVACYRTQISKYLRP